MEKNIFYAPNILTDSTLPANESNHCIKVLRKKEGDEIIITDGNGHFFNSVITEANHRSCLVRILSTIKSPKCWKNYIHIAFAPTKNMDRIEWFVEKATEIGIDEFSPILCRYSERKELKNERILKILTSAMKQSQKATLPKLNNMEPFDKFIKQTFAGQKFIAHCNEDITKRSLKDIYKTNKNVLIVIGPEGDFSEKEIAEAIKNGFETISLGDSRLRTETAALFACNAIQVINQ